MCKLVSFIQNIANPPLLWSLGTASMLGYCRLACIFLISSIVCFFSMRNKTLGTLSLTRKERAFTVCWFTSSRQFQLMKIIVLGGAGVQPPPLLHFWLQNTPRTEGVCWCPPLLQSQCHQNSHATFAFFHYC